MARNHKILVSAEKGGVGKTTVSVNLAVKLQLMGYDVLLVDYDTTNPSDGFYLGLEDANVGLREVLSGRSSLQNAIIVHSPSGLHVLPGTVVNRGFLPKSMQVGKLMSDIDKLNYDFIVIDSAPGVLVEETIPARVNEALVIATCTTSACISAVRLAHFYDKMSLRHNLVLNKVKNTRYELNRREIEEMYGEGSIAQLPDDEAVVISEAEHIPIVMRKPSAPFSREMTGLAKHFGTSVNPRYSSGEGEKGILARIAEFFRRIF